MKTTRSKQFEAKAHVKNIMQYYLDSFPAEVTKAIYDSKAAMAFFTMKIGLMVRIEMAGEYLDEN
ncbi:hypothetical protein O9993_10570 [Vibrio lentus]|nr:hypothetical protein [Vibrio lentus]